MKTLRENSSFFRSSAEKIYAGLTGIVAAKGSRLLQLIDPSVARLQDSGLLRKWQGDYLFLDVMRKAYRQGIHLEQAVTHNEPIGLKTFERTFTIYVACISLAFVAFLGEVFAYFLEQRKNDF